VEWNKGQAISPPRIARPLRPFKVRPTTIRMGQGTEKGYRKEAFEDVWKRYLPADDPRAETTDSLDGGCSTTL
jgi:Protein of unknown function (DUF3631)